ncbi:MAG TPA: DHH family phosphoesterase, partial [Rectinemataceae bacterium]|nr:DHH family phosphoesterase [Rectinemataceae bacterium]
MRSVPRALLEFIDQYDTFYVIGHKEPDGDCVGSQLALSSFLRRNGKGTAVCSAGPFTRTEILSFESRFTPVVPAEKASERAAAIVLDCSSLGRIGSVAETLPPVQIAFI